MDNCQHHRIDNDTCQCKACGEQMIGRTVEAETVLSAPNAAAGLCTIPDCDGSGGCPAVYIPNMAAAREVVIGYRATYECERCRYDGVFISDVECVPDCGRAHRGDFIPARSGVSS